MISAINQRTTEIKDKNTKVQLKTLLNFNTRTYFNLILDFFLFLIKLIKFYDAYFQVVPSLKWDGGAEKRF